MIDQIAVHSKDKVPEYVFYCLEKLVLPLFGITILFYLFEYPDFFYRYNLSWIMIGTLLLVFAFSPLCYYFVMFRGLFIR